MACFQVKCVAISVPKAEAVSWKFSGQELNSSPNSTQFTIQEEFSSERVISTIVLLEPTTAYFGNYNCTVTNSYGSDSAIIKLTTHSKFIVILSKIILISNTIQSSKNGWNFVAFAKSLLLKTFSVSLKTNQLFEDLQGSNQVRR